MRLTTFVVGAGASTEFGLPIGTDLAAQIGATVAGELQQNAATPIISSGMKSGLPGDYGAAARDLAGGMVHARSIDRFLDSRKERPLVAALGKRAIAATLARAEASSFMGQVRDGDWHTERDALLRCSTTWLARLFGMLQAGLAPEQASQVLSQCRFVVFNYDRCIERYLELGFSTSLAQSREEAARLVRNTPIVHIYGSLGPLPTSGEGTAFGPADDRIDEMAGSLRTFTESADERVLARAQGMIIEAERIVMLGFGFDPLNLRALFAEPLRSEQYVLATAVGISGQQERSFVSEFHRGFETSSSFQPMTCADLIASNAFRENIEI